MTKDKITDYNQMAEDNTDVGGVDIAGPTGSIRLGNDAIQEVMSHLAETNAGTNPVADTWSFADPADLTKKVRLDAGNVTAGNTRVLTMPDANVSISSFMATVLDDASASAARTTLDAAGFLGVQILTSSGTYTPTTGTRKIVIEAVGGGGGGGHGNSSSGGVAAAGGGGGGEYVRYTITSSLAASYSYTIGAGGTGGSSSANSGGTGGDTTFGTGPIITAKGGGGGSGNNNQTTAIVGGGGGSGGSGGTGDFRFAGENGDYGTNWSSSIAISGKGGRSVFSNGGGAVREAVAQNTVSGYGGGGGGGCGGGTTSRSGANGSNGVIYVWEFG